MHEETIAREWQRQEEALAAQRNGQPGGDAAYRLVSQALASPPPVDLPADFAQRLARLAERLQAPARPGLEHALSWLAVALLGGAALLAHALNPGLAPGMWASLQSQAQAGWLLWLALALGLTALLPYPSTQTPSKHP